MRVRGGIGRVGLATLVLALGLEGALGCKLQPRGTPVAQELTAPEFSLLDHDGTEVALSELLADGPAVIVFYRGHWCPHCRRQLSELTSISGRLRHDSVDLVAISVDHPAESKMLVNELGLDYPLLSDPKGQVAGRYGVLMVREELAVPAVFVVAGDGTVMWRFVSPTVPERAPIAQIMTAVEQARARKPAE